MSLSYAHYGHNDFKTDENITVGEWKDIYKNTLHVDSKVADYGGYVYDAVWMYAYALDKLLQEDKSYVVNFQNKFVYQ